jgi:hypothetical protein
MKPGVSWALPGRTRHAANHEYRPIAFEYGDAAPVCRRVASLHAWLGHSDSERTSRPISACAAARTGLPSCMTR